MNLHNPNLRALLFFTYLYVILPFAISLVCMQTSTTAAAPTNETDRLALLIFKESIPHDPYGIFSSWNDSIHFCNWYGVRCSRRHQRVAALDLEGYKLRGFISPYIGNLSFLRLINLRKNDLYGEIPQEVGKLFRLQHLYLSNNSLGGEIPIELSNCTEILTMNILWNNLTGKIPIELRSLMKLVSFQIGQNKLRGRFPSFLGNLSSLRIFSIAGNIHLEGNIPEDIGRLRSLSLFLVGMNKLSGMIPSSLYNISSLNIFSVVRNQLTGTLPTTIGLTLPNLRALQIAGNDFSGSIPISICNASRLRLLDLNNNSFVGQVPTNLGNLSDLVRLNLEDNYLGMNSSHDLDFISSLRNCSKLESLGFNTNQFGGVLPNSIANLSIQLSRLAFGRNEISGIIPAGLENLANLIVLGMETNLFTGIIPTYFGKFQKMQIMNLAKNRLSGKIPTSIGNLTQLAGLNLYQNKLEGSIPPSIENCHDLQHLDISENNLSGAIPHQLIGLSSLSALLNLSHNSFSGELPVEIGKLININKLDVSENSLSGGIPKTIGSCLSLEYLGLQGNSFEGILPSSVASLKVLIYLDVSRNNLSGRIPEGLEKLQYLKYLNLSFNDIEGVVPTQGVFTNESSISLIGNSKLCGGIPQLKLPACPIKVKKSRKFFAFRRTIIIVCVVLSFLMFSTFLVLCWRKKSKKKPSPTVSTKDSLPTISYNTLYQVTNGFSPSNLIGSGSFGSVNKGVLDQEEKTVAIKVLNLQQKGASKSFMAECNALRNIRHQNLVKIVTCCSSINYSGIEFKALVFEFMTNGNLDLWLHPVIDSENQSRNLSLVQRLNIAIDVAYALDYLHNHCEGQIIHCDLKPSNVLLDNDMVAHVSDFGLARLLTTTNDSSQKQSSTIGLKGTIGYAAPEYGMGDEASTEGDVYSYGIFVLEMFTGRRPTHEMFKDNLNLHNFAKMALPERLVQVVDPTLLPREVEERRATTVTTEEDNNNNDNEIVEETINIENLSHMNADMQKCLLSVLDIGVACSVESPKERMSMVEVTNELHVIKKAFVDSGIRRRRPNRTQVREA